MKRYFKKVSRPKETSSSTKNNVDSESSKKDELEAILDNLPSDPARRKRILDYDPNIRDEVQRHYFLKGPCQPRNHEFPQTLISGTKRRFVPSWFDEHPEWLEYSIENDAVFCLCCYLFKPHHGDQGGGDKFTCKGFFNWKNKKGLQDHVEGLGSVHNQALLNCQALMNQKQHLESVISRQLESSKHNYYTLLNASIDCVRFLLRQGLAFRGHDESESSNNRGNFLELLEFLTEHNDSVKAVAFENAPRNLQLTSPVIQKDIINAGAVETLNVIMFDMGDAPFSILVDEARDHSIKEQMAVVLRYVDDKGQVIERFVGIQHVKSTDARSLKLAIDELFSRNGLSISNLRGQGYDGASNMQVTRVVNIVGASCKCRDLLREQQQNEVMEALHNDELLSGKGLNQETTLKRPSDTRWGSHYGTLLSIISMFSSTIKMIEMIIEDGTYPDQRGEGNLLLAQVKSFDFIFCLFLMRQVLGVTNDLSQALQKNDHDIVNAMDLVKACKQQLQTMREDECEWETFLDKVYSFCGKHGIKIPNMDDVFVAQGKSQRRAEKITNLHHYRVEVFYTVIDRQLSDLNDRFNEVNSELLVCVASLSPDNLFSAFDKQKLLRLAKFYPRDFSERDVLSLEDKLDIYLNEMRSNSEFSQLKGIGSLAKKLVETGKHKTHVSVYKLLTLALVLPVATASVERVFSTMNIVKNPLRNRMGDQWMNDSLLVYIEKDIFNSIGNDAIMQRFQNMRSRRGQLPSR
ncbi:zinc finger MYM-type protein 1-like [Rosa chinensis]|uniref:zinc finger MYM-type protein 1-like n=1 Tax=Rosa chinensis TaxID=74649 RepID=UPI000D0978AD|nr:zinc finger MYM-type protein 1-like [Rosa chinensis]